MRWCFQNATHPYADTVLQTLVGGQAIVPILWRYEVSAVLAKAQKDGILTGAKISDFLGALQSFNIALDPDSADHILTDVHQIAVHAPVDVLRRGVSRTGDAPAASARHAR
jgi:hypothetical protein